MLTNWSQSVSENVNIPSFQVLSFILEKYSMFVRVRNVTLLVCSFLIASLVC